MAIRRLPEHKVVRKNFQRRTDNHQGPFSVCQFSGLLHHILINPHKADYVEQLSIEKWYLLFFRPEEDNEREDEERKDEERENEERKDEEDEEFHSRFPYSESKMEAYENAVRNSESIPSKEE